MNFLYKNVVKRFVFFELSYWFFIMVYLFNIGFYRGSIKEIVIIDDEIEEEEEI